MDGQEPLDARELARSNERLREQQGAIGGVLRTVVRSAELQPVLDEVSDAARRLCAGEYASLRGLLAPSRRTRLEACANDVASAIAISEAGV